MNCLKITLISLLIFFAVSSKCVAETFKIPPPGNSGQQTFPGCKFNRSTSTYVCSEDLELSNNDVIEFRGNSSLPVTFDVAGKISFGNNVRINEGGSSDDLVFDAEEGFEVGNDSVLVGTISGATEVDLGARVRGVGDIINVNRIDIGNGSQVDGNLQAFDAIELRDRVTVSGGINAGGDFDAGNGVNVGGNIDSSGETSAGEDFILGGSLFSGDTLELGNRADISGNVGAQNNIEIGEESSVRGSLTTFGADEGIDLGNRATVTGNINSSGDFEVGEDSRITGNVTAEGEIDIDNRTNVGGSLDAGDEVEVGEDASITDNINAKGPVELGNRSVVGGYVNAPNGDGDLGNGTVNGPTCDQNDNVGGCSGNTPNLAQCQDVWPAASVYADNSIPKPIALPDNENQTPLPQQLQPIDYLRVAPSGGFNDVGADYETNGQTSRVYIEGDLTIQEDRQINIDGTPDEFILVVTGDLTIERNVTIKGYIYVGGTLFIQRGANGNNQIEIEGAISVSTGSFYLSGFGSPTPPSLTYVAPEFPLNGGQFCSAVSPQPPSPLLNWKLNDGPWDNSAGQIIDSSGNEFDGTSSSVAWSNNTPAIPTDFSGEGTCGYGEFDYTQSQSIQIDDDADGLNDQLDFGTGEEFTVGVWIKPTTFNPSSSLMTIVSKDTNYEFHVRDDGIINWWWNTESGDIRQFNSSTAVSLGVWQYVAIRYKDGEQNITVLDEQFNIVSKTTETYGGGLRTNDRPFILGNDFNQTRYFDGDMDELSVFNESLTDSQLVAVAHQTTLCQTAGQVCLEPALDQTSFRQDWQIIESSNTVPRIINSGSPSPRLRLTENTQNQTTAITLKQPVAAAGNRVEVTFRLYAYDGSGADGIALVLSDKIPTNAGEFGGSLGYANANGNPGFDGGWLGIGFDAFGNFANATEGRNGGIGLTPDSVTLRGSSDTAGGSQRYQYIGTSGTLSTGIDDASDGTPEPGHLYKVVVDNTETSVVSVEVFRDISGQGNNFTSLYKNNDISTLQPAIPNQFYISFAGSTGGSTNIHEFDLFQVCTSAGNGTDGIEHYRLEFNSPALTCTGADVTVRACKDANCNTTSSDTSEVELSLSSVADDWSENPVTFSGSDTIQLQKYTAGTSQLKIDSALPLGAKPDRCFVNGVESANCQITFNDTGFLFTDGNNLSNMDLPKQIAGTAYENLFIHTVELNSNTQTCQSTIAQLSDIKLRRDCVNPSDCSPVTDPQAIMSAATGAGAANLPANETYTALPVDFSNGYEGITIDYGDVGEIRLTARATLSNGKVIENSSQSFVWEPAEIGVSSSSFAEAFSGDIIARAGDPISVELKALNSDGLVTPNFGNESSPERLELSSNVIVNKAGEVPGTLSGVASFSNPVNGKTSSSGIVYSEVGEPLFTAVIASEDYLAGVHAPRATPTQTHKPGRYIPYNFTITTSGFASTCEFNAKYYYIGQSQPLDGSTQLSAVNAAGVVTKNYDSALPYVPAGAKLEFYPFNEDSDSTLLPEPSQVTPQKTGLSWSKGIGTFPIANTPSVRYDRLSNTVEGPYKEYQLGIQYNDGEGCDSDGRECHYYSTIDTSGTELSSNGAPRSYYALNGPGIQLFFARVKLENIFGPPTEPLPIQGQVQYWDGSEFRLAMLDSCTAFDAEDINDDLVTDDYDAELQPQSGPEQVVNSGQLFDSSASIANQLAWLEDSDNSVSGIESFLFELNVPEFLKYDWNDGSNFEDNPQAEATFGIYRGSDRQIYWREVGW